MKKYGTFAWLASVLVGAVVLFESLRGCHRDRSIFNPPAFTVTTNKAGAR